MELYLVDAFTARPFAGNAAAVCLLDGPRETAWMQSVAQELNQAATAFFDGARGLRWFSPAHELELCGHGTLATSHVLWEERNRGEGPIVYDTRAGELTATRGPESDLIELDFPAGDPQPAPAPPRLEAALGARPVWLGRNTLDYVAELASEDAVRQLEPDLAALKAVDARGIIVTARSDAPDHDFVSRFFAPAVGIDEDSVTGSAHCALAPYWARKLGRDRLTGYQASRRGGTVNVHHRGDRVTLGGRAVTVLRGSGLRDAGA
jgi:PhzF family phenazine biosynthesis protein